MPADQRFSSAPSTAAAVVLSTAPVLVESRERLRKEVDAARAEGRRVGFVPTMGALHEGHASLIDRAAGECDVVVASIFVNPLQFGAGEDLDRYPRRLAADLAVAGSAGAALVFAPDATELWPGGRPVTSVRVGPLAQVLEGASRPGHFDGVATVVTTLLNLVGPCAAYFGEKDFQQLVVVRRLVADLGLPVEVAGCATVREPDGLARSSRNAYLSAPERAAAPVLHRALQAALDLAEGGEQRARTLVETMAATVLAEPLASLDYAEVVDPETLAPVEHLQPGDRLVLAAHIGGTRLIDNLAVSTERAVATGRAGSRCRPGADLRP